MARQFKITIDGTTYDVAVEETSEGNAPKPPAIAAPRPAAAAPSPSAASTQTAEPPPAPAGGGGLGDVVSPLAGTIVEVHVKAGDQVGQGQTVITLEAMKMNTAVTASRSGTVTSVAVQAGASVGEGQVLLSIS